jgi:nucleotide-binding universal stress UspA family protein
LCTGIQRALAVISSHYVGVDLDAISDGYVMAEDKARAEEEVAKLVEVAEAPGAVLAKLFEDEVIPPPAPADDSNRPTV